jgi:ubiquinone/menaquinone biosynthesis C-methylase UbiE
MHRSLYRSSPGRVSVDGAKRCQLRPERDVGCRAVSYDGLTKERWANVWGSSDIEYDPAREPQLRDALELILRHWPEPRTGRFLEAGCGPAANSLNLAKLGIEVVGVDLTQQAVEGARDAFVRHGVEGQFLLGDVRQLPFPDGSFEFVYAGGVVEHFRESSLAVAEMARVLRPGGRVLFTVPALTLSYPYLFMRGNVPALPLLEDIVSFVQFRLLGGKLATFGYERSLLARDVRRLLTAAQLDDVVVHRFDTYLPLLAIPARLRPSARRLARTNLFAPMYYGTGVKRASEPQGDATD